MQVTTTAARSILTRTSGYLTGVTTHSLQPYRGCSFGNALCGVGCYVQHNRWLTRGEPWGSFLEVKVNAAELYREEAPRERRWANRRGHRFSIFMSSSTDPFVPHEARYRVTASVLDAMLDEPPDELIVQTHSHRVGSAREVLLALATRTELRVHLSIESDRDTLPGLPPPASSVERRLAAAERLHDAGIRVVITVAPLLPIDDPHRFFARIGAVADAVVIDHFVGGDGTADGSRTARTRLPAAMTAVDTRSVEPGYRDDMVAIARETVPEVGIGADGFAGRYS